MSQNLVNLFTNDNAEVKRKLDEILRHEDEFDPAQYINAIDEESSIEPGDFFQCYAKLSRPVILRDAIKNWPAIEKWSFEYFGKTYGDTPVVANLYNVNNKNKTTLHEFADIVQNSESENPVYLQEWWFQKTCPQLIDDIVIPPYFSDDENRRLLGFHNTTLWMGQRGAFTPIHQDTVHANVWTAQIRGSKEWTLIDPYCFIYPDENGNADYREFFSINRNCIMRGVLNEGDILYMPYKWWHRATTCTDAISLNTFYITPDIVQAYLKDVLTIPLAVSLNGDLIKEHDPMRYNICIERTKILTQLLGLNTDNIMRIDTSGAARDGIYAKAAA